MSQTLQLRMELAEARGQIPEGMATQMMYSAVAAAGSEAAIKAYYGAPEFNLAMAAARTEVTNAQAEQRALDIAEDMIHDIMPYVNVLNATQVTSDFPIALGMLRERQIRDAYTVKDSYWRNVAVITTVPNFNPIRSLSFTEMPELKLRPENTDVTYAKFSEAEGGYRAANYERAVAYTWEMHLADEVGMFSRMLASLGRGARRTETIVVFEAIKAGLVRTPLTTALSYPNIERLAEMERILTSRAFRDSDGNIMEIGLEMSDVFAPTRHRQPLRTVLDTPYVDAGTEEPNPMKDAFDPRLEPLMSRVLGTDIIGFDGEVEWLEVAFVQGFQGGPLTYTEIPNVREHPDQGSFNRHAFNVKLGHAMGAKVVLPHGAIRAEMSALAGTEPTVVVG